MKKSKKIREGLSPQARRWACWSQQCKNSLIRPEELAHILWQKDFSEEILMLAGNRSGEWPLTASPTTDQLTTNIENTMLLCTLHHTSPLVHWVWSSWMYLFSGHSDPFYWRWGDKIIGLYLQLNIFFIIDVQWFACLSGLNTAIFNLFVL